MVYMGGLTFDSDEPSKFLKIPNRVAAQRFGNALLSRIGLYESLSDALRFLHVGKDLKTVLAAYRRLMQQRDVRGSVFEKSEEHHRDSIWFTILTNPALSPTAELQVRKVRSLSIRYRS